MKVCFIRSVLILSPILGRFIDKPGLALISES